MYGVFRDAELHLARLAQVDADLEVDIGSLVDSPGAVREVSARLQVDAGRLLVPFSATIGGAAIEGALSADATAGVPGFGLPQYLHAVKSGQHYIQKDQIKISRVQIQEESLPVAIGLDAMAVFFQGRPEPFLDADFIVHYRDVHGTPDSGPDGCSLNLNGGFLQSQTVSE